MVNTIENRTEEYRNNAMLLMPMTALPKYTQGFNDKEQAILQSLVEQLSTKFHFLGELTLEDKRSLVEFGIDEDKLPVLQAAMEKFNLGIYTVPVYNLQSALRTIRNTPLPKEHGTARKDKIRNFLIKEFGKKLSPDETIGNLITGTLDSSHNLVLRFNLNAEVQNIINKNNINDSEITDAVNGTLKRVIRQAFLKAVGSTVPTDTPEMAALLDSNDASSLFLGKGNVKCVIPLTPVTYGAFQGQLMTNDDVAEDIKSEIGYGLKLAIGLKAAPN